jgi:hypothetical protein
MVTEVNSSDLLLIELVGEKVIQNLDVALEKDLFLCFLANLPHLLSRLDLQFFIFSISI